MTTLGSQNIVSLVQFFAFLKKLVLIIYFPLRQREVYRAEISYNLHVIVCGGLPFMAAPESGF